jgi:hypothetical protein
MKHLKRYLRLILILAMLLCSVVPVSALSGSGFDPSAQSTLTIIDQVGNTPISDVNFRLYKVAEITAELDFVVTDEFQNAGVSISKDNVTWSVQASTLEAYVVERSDQGQELQPAATGTTDSLGRIEFPALPSGLYLLVGDGKISGVQHYKCQPVLLTLPYQEAASSWNTEPTVYPKNSIRELRDTTTELSVVKVWKDSGATSQRPESVTVNLYQDEEFYASVTLREENSWRYTWYDLDSTADYYVVEQNVPSGYTSSVEQEGTAFVVTNTYTPTETPDTPSKPTPTDSPTPTNTNNKIITTSTKLPQTGQLWWPVTALALLGLVTLVLGFGIYRRGQDHEA